MCISLSKKKHVISFNGTINISCQAEDFIAEVEAFGQVRHKNLVKLLGYCIEGTTRYKKFSSFSYIISSYNFSFST